MFIRWLLESMPSLGTNVHKTSCMYKEKSPKWYLTNNEQQVLTADRIIFNVSVRFFNGVTAQFDFCSKWKVDVSARWDLEISLYETSRSWRRPTRSKFWPFAYWKKFSCVATSFNNLLLLTLKTAWYLNSIICSSVKGVLGSANSNGFLPALCWHMHWKLLVTCSQAMFCSI